MTSVYEPYIGPRPFEQNDRDRFFGRDREARDLRSLLIAQGIVVLYARSGAGKSSLVNAALIPMMIKEYGFRVYPKTRVFGLTHAELQLPDDANLYLGNIVAGLHGTETLPRSDDLVAYLGVNRPLKGAELAQSPQLVIVDQFEEIFAPSALPEQSRKEVFEALSAALKKESQLRILLVLREEYVAALDRYKYIFPDRLRTRIELEPMRTSAARRAITGPLKETTRNFQRDAARDIDAARDLAEELAIITVASPDGRTIKRPGEFVEPVQLQIVCQRLWSNLPPGLELITTKIWRTYADVNIALREFYEDCLEKGAETNNVTKPELRHFFEESLITSVGTRGTVVRGAKETGGILNEVIDVLESSRIIRREKRAGADWYEVTHDRLISPIRASNAAAETEDQAILRQKELRSNRLAAGIIIGFLLAVGIPSFFYQSDTISRQEKEVNDLRFLLDSDVSRADRSDKFLIDALRLNLKEAALTPSATPSNGSLNILRRGVQSAFVEIPPAATSLRLEDLTFLNDTELISAIVSDVDGQTADTLFVWHADARHSESFRAPEATRIKWVRVSDGVVIVIDEDDRVHRTDEAGDFNQVVIEEIPGDIYGISPHGRYALVPIEVKQETTESDDSVRTRFTLKVVATDAPDSQSWIVPKSWSSKMEFAQVAVSDDGNRVVLLSTTRGQIEIFTKDTDKSSVKRCRICEAISVSKDGDRVAVSMTAGQLLIYEFDDNGRINNRINLTGHEQQVTALAFSEDAELLASASDDGIVKLWNIDTRVELGRFLAPPGVIARLDFSPGAVRLMAYSRGGSARIWDISSSHVSRFAESAIIETWTRNLAFSRDGSYAVGAGVSGDTWAWNLATNSPAHIMLNELPTDLTDISLSNDNRRLATLARNEVSIWDLRTGKIVDSRPHQQGEGLLALAFSPNEKWLATTSWDGTVTLWNADDGKHVRTLKAHDGIAWDVSFSPDGHWLATAGSDGVARLWEVGTWMAGPVAKGHTSDVRRIAFNNDGSRLATASWDTTAAIWDTESGELVRRFIGHTRPVNGVSFSPDGRRLATAASDGKAAVWSVRDGTRELLFGGHRRAVRDVRFGGDGRVIASSSADGTVQIWDANNGDVLHTMSGKGGTIWSIAFDADGGRLAAAEEDGRIEVWNTQTGDLLMETSPTGRRINAVTFGSNNEVVSVGEDRKCHWWNPATPTMSPFRTLSVSPVTGVKIDPTGEYVLIKGEQEMTLWHAAQETVMPLTGAVAAEFSNTADTLRLLTRDGLIRNQRLDGETNGKPPIETEIFLPRRLALSMDDSYMLVLSDVGQRSQISRYNILDDQGRPISAIDGSGAFLGDVALSPTGKLIATIESDRRERIVRVWDHVNGSVILELNVENGLLAEVEFVQDGKYLAYAQLVNESTELRRFSIPEFYEANAEGLYTLAFASLTTPKYKGLAESMRLAFDDKLDLAASKLRQVANDLPDDPVAERFSNWADELESGNQPFTPAALLSVLPETGESSELEGAL